MTEDKAQSRLFGSLVAGLLSEGRGFRFRALGRSMHPAIRDGEIVHVKPVAIETLRKNDIVLFAERLNYKAHRLVWIDAQQGKFIAGGFTG